MCYVPSIFYDTFLLCLIQTTYINSIGNEVINYSIDQEIEIDGYIFTH